MVHGRGLRYAAARGALAGLVVVVGLSQSAGSSAAQRAASRAGNVIFTPPAGWSRRDQGNAVLFLSPHATGQQAAILAVLPGQVLQGSFRTWFDTAVRHSLGAGERVVTRTAVQPARATEGYDVLYTVLTVQGRTGARSPRFFLGAHPGNRAELIAFFATDEGVFKRYQPVLMAFISSVEFANMTPGGTAPAPQPAAPHAPTPAAPLLYAGETSSLQFVANIAAPGGGSYQYRITRLFLLFLPGGRVRRSLPSAAAPIASSCDQPDPRACGSYTADGDTLTIQWDAGGSEQLLVQQGGDTLLEGTTPLHRVPAAPAGRLLDGTFGVSGYVDTSGAGGTGGVGSENSITLRPDGTFSVMDFVGFSTSGPAGSGTSSDQTTGTGTYHVDGYTLGLTYADGSTRQAFFYILPDPAAAAGRPDAISIDGRLLLKRAT